MNEPLEADARILQLEADALMLARLAIEVLDAQLAYFKLRTRDALIDAKQLERSLRKLAQQVIDG